MAQVLRKKFPVIFTGIYVIAACLIVGASFLPFLSLKASITTDYTFTGGGTRTVGPSYGNELVMSVLLPINKSGVDSITDTLIAGTGTPTATGSATFPAGWNFYGYDVAGGGQYNNAADWIGTDDDSDGVYTSAADTIIINNADAPAAGAALHDVVAGDRLCADNSDAAVATIIWTSTADGADVTTCTADDTVGVTYLGAPPAANILIVTGNNWATTDAVLDGTTDIYKENVAEELTYSAAADTLIAGVAQAPGSALVNMNSAKPASWTQLLILDIATSGVWESGSDFIFNDDDTSGYYNADELTSIQVGNAGTCVDSDLDSIYVWEDSNNNSAFDPASDTVIGFLNSAPMIGQTILMSASDWSATDQERLIFISIDTSATPTDGCTFKARIPQNSVVLASDNDGPTDGVGGTALGDTLTIDSAVTITDGNITITSTGLGTGGAYKAGDTVVAEWDNSVATGDGNTDLTSATVDFSSIGGGAAVGMEDDGVGGACNDGGAGDDIWCAAYAVSGGAPTDTSATISVTANDSYGNTNTQADSTSIVVDNIVPAVTNINIDMDDSGCLGTGGICIVGDTIDITWDDSADANTDVTALGQVSFDLTALGGAVVTPTANPGEIYTYQYLIGAGLVDSAGLTVDVTVTDDAGNVSGPVTSIDSTNIDNEAPLVTSPGQISLFADIQGDGIASIGDSIEYAAGTETTDDGITWQVDLLAYGLSPTAGVGTYILPADDDDNVAFSADETVTDDAGNTQSGAPTATIPGIPAFTDIDNVAPTLSNIHIESNNALDSTLAKAGDTVFVTFAASEDLSNTPPPVMNFYAGGFAVFSGYLVGDDGVTCGDSTAGDGTWTACYTVSTFDTEGNVTFDVTVNDLANNSSSTYTQGDISDGSSVYEDLSDPAIIQINALKQDDNPPAHVTNNWYYYPGQTIKFEVTSDNPLSMLRACIRSIVNTDPTDFCSPEGANYFLTPGEGGAGTVDVDFINPSGPPVGNVYTFSQTLAGLPALPTLPGGYGMALFLVDEAGNVTFSTSQADSFGAVFGINPADGSIDALLTNPPSTTTDWSTILDFTDVTGLKFEANTGAAVLGSLELTSSVNLTDTATITALQNFADNIMVGPSDGLGTTPSVGINTAALAALNQPATFKISAPAGSQPGLVVYNNDGTSIEGYINSDGSVGSPAPLDSVTVTSWVGNVITFDTSGILSFFGTDNTAPTVNTLSPLDNATGVAIDANLVMTFSEDVQDLVLKTITIYRSDATVFESYNLSIPHPNVTFAGNIVTINPTLSFVNGTSYYVQISNDAIQDMVGNNYAGIADNSTWNFTTAAVIYGGGGGYTPPPAATNSIVIANGAAETTTKTVSLSLSGTNATSMMISNDADFAGATWESYATSKTWTLTDNYGTKTVYAKFRDASNNISASVSDAISYVETLTIPTEEANLVLQDPAPAPALPPQVTIGTLVKLDGSSSVYFIDQDNRRHAFPNQTVYLSYYPDFSGVQTISSAIMAAIPLGSNVTMRPGTYLVKIQSDPKVYAVAPYGVLKWISTEALAISLYGADWGTRIVDVDPTFFINYQMGAAVTTAIHPSGSAFFYQGESKTYYVEAGKKRYVSSDVFLNNKFQNKFIIRNLAPTITYADGVDLPNQGMETIMTLR